MGQYRKLGRGVKYSSTPIGDCKKLGSYTCGPIFEFCFKFTHFSQSQILRVVHIFCLINRNTPSCRVINIKNTVK